MSYRVLVVQVYRVLGFGVSGVAFGVRRGLLQVFFTTCRVADRTCIDLINHVTVGRASLGCREI